MQEEQLYQIALSHLFRNRIRKGLALLAQYGSAVEAWRHIQEPKQQESLLRAERECTFIEQHQIQVLTGLDEGYPFRLRECPDRPLVLYAKGNIAPDKGKFVSIVGTRVATDRGKELTRRLVLDLAERLPDVTIVSGLAYGIDIEAHRAALDAGIPTLIVPAHGLDRIYPALHRPVAIRALGNGGLLTEYMSGTEPGRQNFVARNRIIAGLADAVVVVESKLKGGSLITAQMANDYNRDLFAFPGRPSDENAQGCNDLIRRQKAQLIESADDLIKAMLWDAENTKPKPVQTELIELFDALSPTQRTLLDKLREEEDGMHINSVVMETELPYPEVASELLMMEMQGLVKSLPGGIYRALK